MEGSPGIDKGKQSDRQKKIECVNKRAVGDGKKNVRKKSGA